ncbi:hypothetical protein [Pseudoduganella violaceinigra]|uniref:hypothetical protein n=1 Tax=Pseudoduganella violaceinigra TaxID=246602 RepID=UPI000401E039|nr:hypothetical protein [Pseudoduganella violaceinigra]
MKTRYSMTTGGFYPLEFDYGDDLPLDVMEVPLSDYEAAMARPIASSFAFVNGQLVITPPPPTPFAVLRDSIFSEVRATRQEILGVILQIGWVADKAGDVAMVNAVLAARQGLLNITEAPAVLEAAKSESYEALHAAVKLELKSIAGSAPESLRGAFSIAEIR